MILVKVSACGGAEGRNLCNAQPGTGNGDVPTLLCSLLACNITILDLEYNWLNGYMGVSTSSLAHADSATYVDFFSSKSVNQAQRYIRRFYIPLCALQTLSVMAFTDVLPYAVQSGDNIT